VLARPSPGPRSGCSAFPRLQEHAESVYPLIVYDGALPRLLVARALVVVAHLIHTTDPGIVPAITLFRSARRGRTR
jgi:hypothetical protein